MSRSHIVAAARVVDGEGTLEPVETRWAELKSQGARLEELLIDPLETGWHTPVEPNHFRSGCAPIEALAHADALVREGRADAVLIRGRDPLRTRYAQDKQARQELMAIYGECPVPEAYTRLAHVFMRLHGIDEPRFKRLAEALYENYVRTARAQGSYRPPRSEAFELVTELFRAVDCANPVVDFEGGLIVAKPGPSSGGEPAGRIAILGVGLGRTAKDGPAHVEEIARYGHLAAACKAACAQASVDLASAFVAGRALLEAYTCFPVAPLGFLLASGIARDAEEIPSLLEEREITVTGGMNLARAPWNNPSLNALIVMCRRMRSEGVALGAVHGNGGLGYRQGVALLGLE